MTEIAVKEVQNQYNNLLRELQLTPAEKAATKAAHDENFNKAKELVSKAILDTTTVNARKTLIAKLRETEKAFRKKNPNFQIQDPLSDFCYTVDQNKNFVPFKGQDWWKQYEQKDKQNMNEATEGKKD